MCVVLCWGQYLCVGFNGVGVQQYFLMCGVGCVVEGGGYGQDFCFGFGQIVVKLGKVQIVIDGYFYWLWI